MEQFESAVELRREVVRIFEGKFEPNHPLLAESRRRLALLLDITGETEDAAKLDALALAVIREQPRWGDTNVPAQLNDQGNDAYKRGEYKLAESLYESSLSTYEKALGPEHANVIQLQKNVALAIGRQGRMTEGRVRNERAKRLEALVK